MDSSIHISTRVDACGRGFLNLTEALTNAPRYADQIRLQTVRDELDRFKIWAGNIAAHRKGRRSLEHRLRDAAHLNDETHNLLAALQDSLDNALTIVNGEKTPWDELTNSDTDSESDAELSDGVDIHDIQGDTELKQLMFSMKSTITCLFRLSMAIRDPAPNSQFRSIITVDKSIYEVHDILHVKEKFPNKSSFLVERLGRAISGRRQYLAYREQHHQKLSRNVESIGYEEPRTEHTTNSTEASVVMPNDVCDDYEDTLSQTSYATSVTSSIRVPSLPKEARDNEHFECPLCFMIVSIHTTAAWKQHVYRDLHPYCCTFEHCITADRLYHSRHAWFKHELEAHRTAWHCIEGCDKIFQSEEGFVSHVQTRHPEIGTSVMFSALKRTSVKCVGLSEQAKCPLCEKQMELRILQRHLGHHQEQLALFALPPNLGSTEDDSQDENENQYPVDGGKWKDEEPSDMSDFAESDNLSGFDNDLPKDMSKDQKAHELNSEDMHDTAKDFLRWEEAMKADQPFGSEEQDEYSYSKGVQQLITRQEIANSNPSNDTHFSEKTVSMKFPPTDGEGKFEYTTAPVEGPHSSPKAHVEYFDKLFPNVRLDEPLGDEMPALTNTYIENFGIARSTSARGRHRREDPFAVDIHNDVRNRQESRDRHDRHDRYIEDDGSHSRQRFDETDYEDGMAEKLGKLVRLERSTQRSEEELQILKNQAVEDWKRAQDAKRLKEIKEKEDKDKDFKERLKAEFGYSEEQIEKVLNKKHGEKKKEDKDDKLVILEPENSTFIKVHRKWLLPATLEAYRLPWDWDDRDPNYIIIKQFITEEFQEELFGHTRRIREGKLVTETSTNLAIKRQPIKK